MIKTLGVMTSGGDSPGMSAAVRAVVRRAIQRGLTIYGIYDGYEGLVKGGDAVKPLSWNDVGGALQKGGTFLGTARSEKFRSPEGRRLAVRNMLELGLDALIVVGGDGSLMGAHVLADEWREHVEALTKGLVKDDDEESENEGRDEGEEETAPAAPPPSLKVIGLPGSIDNDLHGTDMSIGADTALNHIVRAIDNLASTAASHQRTFILETMGRHCGYLALSATLAGGASWVLVPEEELELRWHQKMVKSIERAREIGRPHHMVIVAEGARHPDGLIISSNEVKQILAERLKLDVRVTVLGHVQRGGAPTAFDRIMATRLGVAAVDTLVNAPDADHCHMLGLIKNRVVATPLVEVVEKSQAVRAEVENGNYARAQELRGGSFIQTLELVKTLTRITPAQECTHEGTVAILTGGADSPGMNTAVSVAARCLINQGASVLGVRDGFVGLIKGRLTPLDWNELVLWVNRPGSEIGTARVDFKETDYAEIAANIRRHNIRGLIAIGGWGTYRKVAQLVERRREFDELNIPMVLLPATIDNNLPGTEFSIGVDTALNNIVEAADKIRHTAGATRRTFIVEVMGRRCGFLALMSALATGAEKAYLPEYGISLAELNEDVKTLKKSFDGGKRMVIFMRNEHSSRRYTTDFIQRLMEEESKGQFEVRTAILGHVQRGGLPTAFDRILASRLGANAAFHMLDVLKNGNSEVYAMGLRGRGIEKVPIEEAFAEMDTESGRPKHQWYLDLKEAADALARGY